MKICQGPSEVRPVNKWQTSPVMNWCVLPGCLVIAGLCRLPGLLEIFWRDEVFTAWVADHSPWEVPGVIAVNDVSPPLYYVLLSIWAHLFGDSDLALRSLSLLISFICIVILYFITLRWWGKNTAVCVSLLTATAPGFAYVSQEVRNQVIVSLLLLIAAVSMWQWLQNPAHRRNLWLFIFSATGAIYCHYLAIIAVGLMFIYGVARTASRNSRNNLLLWFTAQIVIVLLLIPWLPGMRQQDEGVRLSQKIGSRESAGNALGTALANLAAEDPLRSIRVAARSQVSGKVADLCAVGLLLVAVVILWRKRLKWDHPVWLLLFLAVGLAVVMACLHNFLGAKSNPRYFPIFSVFLLPVIAFVIADMRPALRWSVLAFICGLQILMCVHEARVAPVPWRQMTQSLGNQGSGLVLSQYWLGGEALQRYGYTGKIIELPFDLPSAETARRRKVGVQLTLPQDFKDLNSVLGTEQSAWLIITNDPGDIALGSDISLQTLNQFAITYGWQLVRQQTFGEADVWRFTR